MAARIRQSSLAAVPWTEAVPVLNAVRLSWVLAEALEGHIWEASGPLSPTQGAEYNAAVRMRENEAAKKKTPLAGSKAQLSTLEDLEMLIIFGR